jgi:hypothetical protein
MILSNFLHYFFAGAGGGVPGVSVTGLLGAFLFFKSSEPDPPAFRVAKIESDIDVNMKTIAEIVVAFERSVAEPLGPKAV